MRSTVLLVASSAATLTVALPAQAVTIYDQLAHMDGGLASSAQPGAYADQRIADDFVLTQAESVGRIQWIGGSENFLLPDLTNFTDFVVQIYENDGFGLPGATVFSQTVPKEQTNPVTIGVDSVSNADLHRFTFDLGTPLDLAAGDYFLSISAVYAGLLDDGFIWNNAGTAVNNQIVAQIPVGNGWSSFSGFGDMAFALSTPAPGTLALLALAGLTGRPRRRRA
ncbi:MAG: hypothetical protein ACYTG1_11390 [Planctomycetota bacterium]|jgi:hypothetical protein